MKEINSTIISYFQPESDKMVDPTLKYAVIYWGSENANSKMKWLEFKGQIQMTSEDDFFFLIYRYNLLMRNFEEKKLMS